MSVLISFFQLSYAETFSSAVWWLDTNHIIGQESSNTANEGGRQTCSQSKRARHSNPDILNMAIEWDDNQLGNGDSAESSDEFDTFQPRKH